MVHDASNQNFSPKFPLTQAAKQAKEAQSKPKSLLQRIANFIAWRFPRTCSIIHRLKVLKSKRKNVVVLTRNGIKNCEKKTYLNTANKVARFSDDRFGFTVQEGTAEKGEGGKCFGGHALFLSNWLQHGQEHGIDTTATLFEQGMPKAAVDTQDTYAYILDVVQNELRQIQDTYDPWQQRAQFFTDFYFDVQTEDLADVADIKNFYYKAVTVGDFARQDLGQAMLEAIEAYITEKGTNPHKFISEFLMERGHKLSKEDHFLILSISSSLSKGVYSHQGYLEESALSRSGLEASERVRVDINAAVQSFSCLEDGAYSILVDGYSNVSRFTRKKRSVAGHALGLIVHQGTTYFYDPNIAIWKHDQEKIASHAKLILSEYIPRGLRRDENITIMKMNLGGVVKS